MADKSTTVRMSLKKAETAVQTDKYSVEAWEVILNNMRKINMPIAQARQIYEEFLAVFPYAVRAHSVLLYYRDTTGDVM